MDPFKRLLQGDDTATGDGHGGYQELPGSYQWSPWPLQRVDKTRWKPCHRCGRAIPVSTHSLTLDPQSDNSGIWTYVCPFCSHCHVGVPKWNEDTRSQRECHECGEALGEAYQCPNCAFPRGWMKVSCPNCNNRQPVCVPHWVVGCDLFWLECVHCEVVTVSLCIC